MELDVIVVLCLAVLIFGGAGYIVWKNRQEERNFPADPLPHLQEDDVPKEPRTRKKKKTSRNVSL